MDLFTHCTIFASHVHWGHYNLSLQVIFWFSLYLSLVGNILKPRGENLTPNVTVLKYTQLYTAVLESPQCESIFSIYPNKCVLLKECGVNYLVLQ